MTRFQKLLGTVAIAFLSALAACIHPETVPVSNAPPAITGISSADASDVKAASDGLTSFAADLYGELRSEQDNLIVSPYSIGTALALTAVGARGETFSQIQRVFHFPSIEKIAPTYGNLAAAVVAPPRNAKQKPDLSTANSLWVQKGHPFRKDYLG